MEPITGVEMDGIRVPDKVMAAVQQALQSMQAAKAADLLIVQAGGRDPDPAAFQRVIRQVCDVVPKARPPVVIVAVTVWCAVQGWHGPLGFVGRADE